MAGKSRIRLPGIDAFLAVGQAFSVDLPTEEAMRRVAREVARAMSADMVGAYVLDASKEALVPVAGYRVPKELLPTLLGTPFPLDRFPVLREAWRTREPVWTLDYRGDPRFDQKFLTEFRPQALLFAPTPVRGEIVGGFFLAWWEARPAFTSDELRLIRGIASQVGRALENGELARANGAGAGRAAAAPRGHDGAHEPGHQRDRPGPPAARLEHASPRSPRLPAGVRAGRQAPRGPLPLQRGARRVRTR